MADLDRLLRADISLAASRVVEPPDFALIEERGSRRRRRRMALVTAAAAVVAVAAAAGTSLVVDHRDSAPPPATPAPPSRTPGSLPTGDDARDQAIQPGVYRVDASDWSAVDYTIAFPEGWTVQYGHIYHFDADQSLTLEAAVVDEIFTDACHGDAVARGVGPRVRDLVVALRRQPGLATSRPVRTTLGGHPATRLDLRIPRGLDLRSCRGAEDGYHAVQIWYSQPADNYFVLHEGSVASVYVLDVDGRRQVFVTQNGSPDSAEARSRLQEVLDSLRIGS